MDTKSGHPFWPISSGLLGNLPPLDHDIRCDVVVIGAGITGTLVAMELADADLDVVMLDRRDAGWGSTAASTALLQYEIDTELVALGERYGSAAAAMAYQACDAAIDRFAERAGSVGDVDFARCGSLYYASNAKDARRFPEEFATRRQAGLDVQLLEAGDVAERFQIDTPMAMWTPHAARVDPYRFTRRGLARLASQDVAIFDRTTVEGWRDANGGLLDVITDRGQRVRCRHIVVAAGYESQQYLRRRVAHNHSSYALVTEPMATLPFDLAHNVAWESARPYLYMRATADHRVLIGGEDDWLDAPAKRDAVLPRKARRLMEKLQALAPDTAFEPGFSWAGTFAETDDGLPFIGSPADGDPRISFAMAYGGNGITYSTIAASILCDRVRGKVHPLAELFGFGRVGR